MKPLLKVCGITSEADAMALAEMGVAYLGYVINHQDSPRYISPETANTIIQKVRRLYPKVSHVGVLVNVNTHDIQALLPVVELDIIQIYEPIPRAPLPIWQSMIMHTTEDLAKLKPANETVIGLHCDAGMGSGNVMHPEILNRLQSELPLIIAGGIGPENIAQILEQCQPDVVDVNSKVESAPGKKDLEKIKTLLSYVQILE